MAELIPVETDDRGQTVLPGQLSRRFLMRVNEDGSILLQPPRPLAKAQSRFDSELDDLLARAAASPNVRRSRQRR